MLKMITSVDRYYPTRFILASRSRFAVKTKGPVMKPFMCKEEIPNAIFEFPTNWFLAFHSRDKVTIYVHCILRFVIKMQVVAFSILYAF